MTVKRLMMIAAITVTPLTLGGCVSAVSSVVTAPFKAAGQAVDWATTSQDEADRNKGRKLRKAEAKAYRECKRLAEPMGRTQCMNERLNR